MKTETVRALSRCGLMPVLIYLWQIPGRLRQRREIARYLGRGFMRRLHLGCGLQPLPGWLNVDSVPRVSGAVFLDVRKRFPFEDGVFGDVFSEHLIEHLDFEVGLAMLRECYRVLEPGGKIRIATPDLDFLIDLHLHFDLGVEAGVQVKYVEWAVERCGLPSECASPHVAVINNFFRDWGHRFIYDMATLRGALESAGFEDCEERSVGSLESHGAVIGDEFNRLETLVLEGRKPREA